MARQLADMRAMEKEANRSNPVRKGATPTMGVSEIQGGGKARKEHDKEGELLREVMEAHKAEGRAMKKGGRAVPSSGLSQFHGGSMTRMVGAGACDDGEEMVGGSRTTTLYSREKAQRPVVRTLAKDRLSESDARGMGKMLGFHIKEIHGGGFYDLFTKGVMEASKEANQVRKVEGVAPYEPQQEQEPQTEEAHGSGYLSGPYEGMGAYGGRTKRGKMMRKERLGMKMLEEHPSRPQSPEKEESSSDEEPMMVYTHKEKHPRPVQSELTLSGKRMSGKGKRTPAKEGDGRKKRAEIVKKVMREKGMKMIEASKYVKAHGLY